MSARHGLIRVGIVDDHPVVRDGLAAILGLQPDIKVVGEACNGREAVQLTEQLEPAVVVMDLVMPLLNGVEATRQILRSRPATKVLILSSYQDEQKLAALIEHGACGYLLKHSASSELLQAIREVGKGNCRRRFEKTGVQPLDVGPQLCGPLGECVLADRHAVNGDALSGRYQMGRGIEPNAPSPRP